MNYVSVSVSAYGIAGRDRKVKFHSKELAMVPADQLNEAELVAQAQAWVATLKQVSKPSLDFNKADLDGPIKCVVFPSYKCLPLGA